MKKIILGALAAATVAGPLALAATPASAVTTNSTSSTCSPVIEHDEYKWVPNVTSAGPTQWTLDNAPANAPRTFVWKGAAVAYHRDGTKSQHIDGVNCAATLPMFDNAGTCSVVVPYTPGVVTRVYGVNGYPETDPITHDVTVTRDNDGVDGHGWAPQFWIGYQAAPGYWITNPGQGQWHIDFNSPSCGA
jgi:hypothetical protein